MNNLDTAGIVKRNKEAECRNCGDEIPDEREGNYCTEECFEKRPLGTGYSKSDHD